MMLVGGVRFYEFIKNNKSENENGGGNDKWNESNFPTSSKWEERVVLIEVSRGRAVSYLES